MFEFEEAVTIRTSPEETWALLRDVEDWWPPSNPEHVGLTVHARPEELGEGTRVTFEERVAGIPGEADGTITEWLEGERVTWSGRARYRYLGLPLTVDEGVSWQIREDGDATRLSARVWARFPGGWLGKLLEWYTTRLLGVVEKDREHARRELEYLKRRLEGGA